MVKQLSGVLIIAALVWVLYQAFGINRIEKAAPNVTSLHSRSETFQSGYSTPPPSANAITRKSAASTRVVSSATLINPWAGPGTSAIPSEVSIEDPDSLPNDACAEMGTESAHELVLWPPGSAGQCRAIKAKPSSSVNNGPRQ
jgi:hypothetical protein